MIARLRMPLIFLCIALILLIALWVSGNGLAAVMLIIGVAAGWFIARRKQEA